MLKIFINTGSIKSCGEVLSRVRRCIPFLNEWMRLINNTRAHILSLARAGRIFDKRKQEVRCGVGFLFSGYAYKIKL